MGLAMKGGSGVSIQTLNVAKPICVALVYRAGRPARYRPRRHGFSLPQAARIGEFGLNSTALLQSPQIMKGPFLEEVVADDTPIRRADPWVRVTEEFR